MRKTQYKKRYSIDWISLINYNKLIQKWFNRLLFVHTLVFLVDSLILGFTFSVDSLTLGFMFSFVTSGLAAASFISTTSIEDLGLARGIVLSEIMWWFTDLD